MIRTADRIDRLGVESAFDVLVRARALEAHGRDIIHLEIGEPDFNTPRRATRTSAKRLRCTFARPAASRSALKMCV